MAGKGFGIPKRPKLHTGVYKGPGSVFLRQTLSRVGKIVVTILSPLGATTGGKTKPLSDSMTSKQIYTFPNVLRPTYNTGQSGSHLTGTADGRVPFNPTRGDMSTPTSRKITAARSAGLAEGREASSATSTPPPKPRRQPRIIKVTRTTKNNKAVQLQRSRPGGGN